MTDESPSTSWTAWLLNFLCSGTSLDNSYMLKVVDDDASGEVRQLSDGDVTINAAFSNQAYRKLLKSLGKYGANSFALHLKQFTLKHALHKQLEKCEFRLHVERFEVEESDLSFLDDEDAQNCMMIASVRRKSRERWKKSSINNKRPQNDRLSCSQLLLAMEEDSCDAPDMNGFSLQTVTTIDLPAEQPSPAPGPAVKSPGRAPGKHPPVAQNERVLALKSPLGRSTTSDEEFFTPKATMPVFKKPASTRPTKLSRLRRRQMQQADFIIPPQQNKKLSGLSGWRVLSDFEGPQETHQSSIAPHAQLASPRKHLVPPTTPSNKFPTGRHVAANSPKPCGSRPPQRSKETFTDLQPSTSAAKQFLFKKPTAANVPAHSQRNVLAPAQPSHVGETTLTGFDDDFTQEQDNVRNVAPAKHKSSHNSSVSKNLFPKPQAAAAKKDQWLIPSTLDIATQEVDNDAESLRLSMDEDDDFFTQPLSRAPRQQVNQRQPPPPTRSRTPSPAPLRTKEKPDPHQGNNSDDLWMLPTPEPEVTNAQATTDDSNDVSPREVPGFTITVPDVPTLDTDSESVIPPKWNNGKSPQKRATRQKDSAHSKVQTDSEVDEKHTSGEKENLQLDTWTCQTHSSVVEDDRNQASSPELDDFDKNLIAMAMGFSSGKDVSNKHDERTTVDGAVCESQDGQVFPGSTQEFGSTQQSDQCSDFVGSSRCGQLVQSGSMQRQTGSTSTQQSGRIPTQASDPPSMDLQTYTQWLEQQERPSKPNVSAFDPNILDSQSTQLSQDVVHSTQIPTLHSQRATRFPEINLSPVKSIASGTMSRNTRVQRLSSSPRPLPKKSPVRRLPVEEVDAEDERVEAVSEENSLIIQDIEPDIELIENTEPNKQQTMEEVDVHYSTKDTSPEHSRDSDLELLADEDDEDEKNSCSLLSKNDSKQSPQAFKSPQKPSDPIEMDRRVTRLQASAEKPVLQQNTETSANKGQTKKPSKLSKTRSQKSGDQKRQQDIGVMFAAAAAKKTVSDVTRGKRKLFNIDTVLDQAEGSSASSAVQDNPESLGPITRQHKRLKLSEDVSTDHQDTLSQSAGKKQAKITDAYKKHTESDEKHVKSVVAPVDKEPEKDSVKTARITLTRLRLSKANIKGKTSEIPQRLQIKPKFVNDRTPTGTISDNPTECMPSTRGSSGEDSCEMIPNTMPTPENSLPGNQMALHRPSKVPDSRKLSPDLLTTLENLSSPTEITTETSTMNSFSLPEQPSYIYREVEDLLMKEDTTSSSMIHTMTFPQRVMTTVYSYFVKKGTGS